MKYNFRKWWRGLTVGQQDAYLNKLEVDLGGEAKAREVLEAYSRDEIKLVFQDNIVKLVDINGRGIPVAGMKGKVVDADRSFYLTKPTVDYTGRLARLQQFFGSEAKFMSVAEFEGQCTGIIARIKGDKQVGNLLKGPYFPFALPQFSGDIGTLLDDIIVPALERSYKAQFPERKFKNYRHGELAGQVTVVPGTGQEQLVEAMAKGPVCGVYFPALQGFGIPADREFIGHLPKYMILAGLEVPVVATAYPEIIGRDWKTPGLDMASLQWRSAACSLCCRGSGDEFRFDHRGLGAFDGYAGGLSVLG